eukprot:scaffold116069_cov99-Phaeocystis_antarctica.AAC.1
MSSCPPAAAICSMLGSGLHSTRMAVARLLGPRLSPPVAPVPLHLRHISTSWPNCDVVGEERCRGSGWPAASVSVSLKRIAASQ